MSQNNYGGPPPAPFANGAPGQAPAPFGQAAIYAAQSQPGVQFFAPPPPHVLLQQQIAAGQNCNEDSIIAWDPLSILYFTRPGSSVKQPNPN